MKLRERINKDYITAFKNKDNTAKSILSVVKSEIQTNEKNNNVELSDDEVIKILNKMAKSLKETISFGDDQAKLELEVIESYLPKQMTKDEIVDKVKEIISNGSVNMGQVMKEFASLQADKKIVSEVVRELLK